MKVLIIPEDQRNDQFILKPIVIELMKRLQVPARINILPRPRLRGAADALDQNQIADIIRDWPMTDLFLLMIDRDCNREKNMERAAARQSEHPGRLISCVAIEEVEVWMLALHREYLKHSWREIRSHCDPKEAFADPLLAKLGGNGPGGGRKAALRTLGTKWSGLLKLCPELAELQHDIAVWLADRRSGSA